MTQIIFLDFDGVLLPDPAALEQSKQGLTHANYLERVIFDPACVARLNHILSATHAQIVLSTSWALGHSFGSLVACLNRNQVLSDLVYEWEDPSLVSYMTPRQISSDRAHEIRGWLDDNPAIVDWVALDDMSVIRRLGPRAIVTDPTKGISAVDAALAIAILS